MATVHVIVKVVARPDAKGQMRDIVQRLCTESRKEAGCLKYNVLENLSEPNVFVLTEEWESETHLDAHNRTAHFGAAVTKAQPLLAKDLDVGRYRAIS